jgi:plastocyanin
MVAAACGGDGGGTTDGGDAGDGGGTTTTGSAVTAVDNAFEPSEVTVDAGGDLTVSNDGEAAHTFTLEDGSIDEQLDPGAEVSVTAPSTAGDYPFVCSFHPEMTGTLTVQ